MTTFDSPPLLELPIIDLSADADTVRRQLDATYSGLGFGYITGHGVPQHLVDRVFAASHLFHALPQAEKDAVAIGPTHRGYIANASSTIVTSSVDTVTRPNMSESFIVGRELAPDDPDIAAGLPLAGPNPWPPSAPEVRAAMLAYQAEMERLCRDLTHHVCAALGMPETHLDAAFEKPTTYLRLLRYEPLPPGSPADLWGSAPHTDYGFLTVLAQDHVPGLQVRLPDGTWIDAPPVPGAFVLNSGDLLHRWSNGRWASTPHRVLNHPTEVRHSVPFFYDPHVSVTVEPLPSCGEPRVEPVNYGDWVMSKFRANYSQHQSGRR